MLVMTNSGTGLLGTTMHYNKVLSETHLVMFLRIFDHNKLFGYSLLKMHFLHLMLRVDYSHYINLHHDVDGG